MFGVIAVKLIEYNEKSHDYKALFEGNEILVNPYVGCAWKNDRIELGEFMFAGDWYKSGKKVFLPDIEVEKN